jgi:hypothetical protein
LRCKILLAFSSSFFLAGRILRPARLMNICTIRIADPIPPGDTFGLSMIRATSAPVWVKVPAGGKVDSVLISRDHLRFLLALVDFVTCPTKTILQLERNYTQAGMPVPLIKAIAILRRVNRGNETNVETTGAGSPPLCHANSLFRCVRPPGRRQLMEHWLLYFSNICARPVGEIPVHTDRPSLPK